MTTKRLTWADATLRREVGIQLAKVRESRGMSVAGAASVAGLDASTIRRLESGDAGWQALALAALSHGWTTTQACEVARAALRK